MTTLLVALLLAASPATAPEGFLAVRDGRFVDSAGRQVLLHGLSIINKDRKGNYQSWHGAAEFARMRDWGMNCVRLGILWDGLEPAPGVFDENYLKGVDQRIAWAKEAGLYVFLDMHQDLYSYKFSDGAPEWATLTDGQPHVAAGGVWSDAYVSSPAIQRAFDNFWANAPCADGVGVQDHFARAWRHVAQRYANEPTVIAFDLFNEPNIGSGNLAAQEAMAGALAAELSRKPGATPVTPQEVAQQWMDVAGRHHLMGLLEDIEIYRKLVDAAGPVFSGFERTQLMPMFQRVRDAIREVDTRHIIFLETSMSANMGIPTGVGLLRDKDGKPDPLQAYAPHGYDIVVDTPDLVNADNSRVGLIFQRHGETAQRLGLPMLIGEWGAYGGADEKILPTARFTAAQFEKLLCGDTYWDYGGNIDRTAYFEVLQRPIPQHVAGVLLSYHGDPLTGAFDCAWKEEGTSTAPSLIYLPARFLGSGATVEVTPKGEEYSITPAAAGSENKVISVPPIGKGASRTLSIKPTSSGTR